MLQSFQVVYGLNINLVKSNLVKLGDERDLSSLAGAMRCTNVKLPVKYLRLNIKI